MIGANAMASPRRDTGPLIALAGGMLILVVLGAAVVTLFGVRGSGDDPAPVAAPTTTTIGTSTTTTTMTVTPPGGSRDAIADREAYMQVSTTGAYGSLPPVVDRLAARTVLRITATGFEPNADGLVEQCTVGGCANGFPVSFDENGTARLQYLVDDAFAKGFESRSRCRSGEPSCVVHLHSNETSAFLTTVFRDGAPPPRRVTVDRSEDGPADGDRVLVRVTGFSPGERVQAMLCAAPDTYGSARCGAPGPVAPFTIDSDGTGRIAMVIEQGRVGSAGASCGVNAPCGIVVSYPESSVPAPVFPIAFAAGPGARYETTRWLAGLAVAALLLTIAFVLARTTDWRKPTEADTPELDRAVLVD